MDLPKILKEEIWEYCRLNNITNIDEFSLKLIKQGFSIEKYGIPINKIVVKEIEKVIEVPIEKIVEIPVSDTKAYDELKFEFEKLKKENEDLKKENNRLKSEKDIYGES
jgi:cell division protein FtsB